MKRIITVYGLITGCIVALFLCLSGYLMLHDKSFPAYGMWIGFGSMLLAFAFIFIAVKTLRERQGGAITFGRAFMTGLWIAVIASIFYTATWVIIYKGFYPTFMDDYTNMQLASLRNQGKSSAELTKATKDMENVKAVYATWPGLIGYTMLEILPLGVLVALVSAFVFKRKIGRTTLSTAIPAS